MRKGNEKTIGGGIAAPHQVGPPAAKKIRAANDNGRFARSVTLVHFDEVPLQAGEIAVVDALMQSWPLPANDNHQVS